MKKVWNSDYNFLPAFNPICPILSYSLYSTKNGQNYAKITLRFFKHETSTISTINIQNKYTMHTRPYIPATFCMLHSLFSISMFFIPFILFKMYSVTIHSMFTFIPWRYISRIGRLHFRSIPIEKCKIFLI